jgi:hypothetical protein
MGETYYTVDSTKIGYGEYWRLSNRSLIAFTFCALKKLFRSRIDFHTAVPRFDHVTKMDAAEMPDDLKPQMEQHLARCRQLNLAFQFYYTIPNIMLQISFGCALLSSDGRTVAQYLCVRTLRDARKTTLSFNCCSKLKDNRMLGTVDQEKKQNSPAYMLTENMPGAASDAILKRHVERLGNLRGTSAMQLTPDMLDAFLVELNTRAVEAQLAAGVYVPLDPHKVDEMRAAREAALKE